MAEMTQSPNVSQNQSPNVSEQPTTTEDKKTLAPPKKVSGVGLRMGTLFQIFRMLKRGSRWWLMPMMAVLGLLGLALAGLQAVEFIAPFIYAVF